MSESKIRVRFMDGKEQYWERGVTVQELKVDIAQALGKSATEVSLFCDSTGRSLENDDAKDMPPSISVALCKGHCGDEPEGTSLHVGDGLVLACACGDLASVHELLVANPVIVNHTDDDGDSCLNVAAENGHLKVVNRLLEARADIHHTNNNAWSSLNHASDEGHLDVVDRLLDAGAYVDHAEANGWTSLHLASHRGYLDVVNRLLDAGADVDQAEAKGWTSLNLASYHGFVDVVERLLAAGADVTHTTADGSTSHRLAYRMGHFKVLKRLWFAATQGCHGFHGKGSSARLLVADTVSHTSGLSWQLETGFDPRDYLQSNATTVHTGESRSVRGYTRVHTHEAYAASRTSQLTCWHSGINEWQLEPVMRFERVDDDGNTIRSLPASLSHGAAGFVFVDDPLLFSRRPSVETCFTSMLGAHMDHDYMLDSTSMRN